MFFRLFFSLFFATVSLTHFTWTVHRYLELGVEVATGNTLGLEMFVFREKNICSAENVLVERKKTVEIFFGQKISVEKKFVVKILINFFSATHF